MQAGIRFQGLTTNRVKCRFIADLGARDQICNCRFFCSQINLQFKDLFGQPCDRHFGCAELRIHLIGQIDVRQCVGDLGGCFGGIGRHRDGQHGTVTLCSCSNHAAQVFDRFCADRGGVGQSFIGPSNLVAQRGA